MALTSLAASLFFIRFEHKLLRITNINHDQLETWAKLGELATYRPVSLVDGSINQETIANIRVKMKSLLKNAKENQEILEELLETSQFEFFLLGTMRSEGLLGLASVDAKFYQSIQEFVDYPPELMQLGSRVWSSDQQIVLQSREYLSPYRQLSREIINFSNNYITRAGTLLVAINLLELLFGLVAWNWIIPRLTKNIEKSRSDLQVTKGELAQKEAMFQMAFESIKDPVCIINKKAEIKEFNTPFRELISIKDIGGPKKYWESDNVRELFLVDNGSIKDFHKQISGLNNCLVRFKNELFLLRSTQISSGDWLVMAINQTQISKQRSTKLQMAHLQEIGTVTASVAHDINNVLAVIKGLVELLKLQNAEDEISMDYLTKIDNACTRSETITNQILLYGRKYYPTRRLISVKKLVRELSNNLLPPKGINITIDNDAGGHTYLDLVMFLTAIENLAKNSFDAMDGNGILNIGFFEEEPNWLVIRFRDNGPGFSEEALKNATTAFYTTKPAGEGTGLGLAMVQSMVTHNDGEMIISNCSEGAEVMLSFPKRQGKATRQFIQTIAP